MNQSFTEEAFSHSERSNDGDVSPRKGDKSDISLAEDSRRRDSSELENLSKEYPQ